jgi:hypothetical protein
MEDGSGGLSRRDFLLRGSLYGGGLWIAANLPRPRALRAAQASREPAVLSAHEWRTVDAMAARIIPSDHEPGAREADCVNFIDKALANEDAQALPLYRVGVQGADAVALERFGAAFAELEAAHQDELLAGLEAGDAPGWPAGPVPAPVFFETLRAHTIIGFLADPRYGGNRDFAGWRVAGYPGPRHRLGGYSPEQMLGEAPITPVWGSAKPKA